MTTSYDDPTTIDQQPMTATLAPASAEPDPDYAEAPVDYPPPTDKYDAMWRGFKLDLDANKIGAITRERYDAENGPGAYERDEALIHKGEMTFLWVAKHGMPLEHAFFASPATVRQAFVAFSKFCEAVKLEPEAESGTTGRQTLAQLPYGAPPDQLVGPFLTPEGVTILYGPGGTGKGVFSTYLAWQLVRAGNRVMVLDYEHHEAEWGRRARGMGYSGAELAMVEYRAPFGPEWTAKKGSLHEVADLIRDDCDSLGVTYIVLDSYTTATSTGDAMGGQAGAQEFFNAIARIGRPALVIAHVAGAAGRFPERPFGSVFVHNLARETWAIEKTGVEDEEPWDPAIAHLMPLVISLELRNKKMNNGARPKPQFISFSFMPDGTIEVDRQQPKGTNVASLITDVLIRSPKGLTASDIAKVIKSDTGEVISDDTMRKTLLRNAARLFKRSDEVPHKWSIQPVRA